VPMSSRPARTTAPPPGPSAADSPRAFTARPEASPGPVRSRSSRRLPARRGH
jgi:hypothetical protein